MHFIVTVYQYIIYNKIVSGCFAVLRQPRSIRRSVPISVFQTLVVALVMPRLDYGNATLAELCVPTSSTSVGSEIWMLQPGWYTGHLVTSTLHLYTPTPPLAAVSWAHRFQVSRACLSMFTRSRSSLPIWLLPTCCLFQPLTTSFIVIIAATDSTNTTHNCRRPSFSSRRKPPLGRSSTRRYVSSDSRCFPKATRNLFSFTL